MMQLDERTPLYTPAYDVFHEGELTFVVDADAPNWAALDSAGAGLLDWIRAGPGTPFGDLVRRYARDRGLDGAKSWLHVHDCVHALARARLLQATPVVRTPYPGRLALTAPEGLRELWLQVNNACNLTCTHCLVSSGPGEAAGPPIDWLIQQVDHAVALGLERLYITGGEPFVRKDLFRLLAHAVHRGVEVIVLTNATIFQGSVRLGLRSLDRTRVRFQVSLDGARPETNDAIRGDGNYRRAIDGAQYLAELGYDVSLTAVTTSHNLRELAELPGIARAVGATSQHLMWPHRRGRAADGHNGFIPTVERLLPAVAATIDAAARADVMLDNIEVVKRRVNGVPGIKYDLGNAGWDSLCIFFDGMVYPSAALAGEPALVCGDAQRESLERILEASPVTQAFRRLSVAHKPSVQDDPLRFLTGGGDWEHAWWFSGGDPLAPDPYYPVAQALVRQVMRTLGREKHARMNRRTGYDAPQVLHAMGEGAIACDTADGALAERPVLPLHSNCVLSFDVDRPRRKVREYYGAAAEQPQAGLCCPTKYDADAVDHIPQSVLDRFYGCGSPMAEAGVQAGETVLDLGSGAGIDVFIAAKLVGPTGRALGVDMTDEMLAVAEEARPRVAEALGYDVVEFRKGFLETLPLEAESVDVVTSNCVINLSPDKPRVFEEIWRVLKNHGRFLISDIVSDEPVPPHLKVNPELWGECLVGALTQEEFLAGLERAGFYGLSVLRKTYWRDVEGYAFHSLTVTGRRYEKSSGCVYRGHRAVYLGPGKALLDEEGHLFPRNEPLEVCTDTVAKLSRPPYAEMFAVLEPGESRVGYACCAPGESCC